MGELYVCGLCPNKILIKKKSLKRVIKTNTKKVIKSNNMTLRIQLKS